MLPLGCSFSCAFLITVLLPSDCVSRLHNPDSADGQQVAMYWIVILSSLLHH